MKREAVTRPSLSDLAACSRSSLNCIHCSIAAQGPSMTYTPEEGAQIFKRDAMGRVRLPRARREELLNEYERSGISGVQFAAYVGVKYSTLASWIQKRERRQQQEESLIRADSGLHSDEGNRTWAEAVIDSRWARIKPGVALGDHPETTDNPFGIAKWIRTRYTKKTTSFIRRPEIALTRNSDVRTRSLLIKISPGACGRRVATAL